MEANLWHFRSAKSNCCTTIQVTDVCVVKNASILESTLAKKHNAINYHAVQEAAAAGILHVGKEDGQTNLADLLTKVLTAKRHWEMGCVN